MNHPPNLKEFLDILSRTIFEEFENGLAFMEDNECNRSAMGRKFRENEFNCTLTGNSGNLLIFVVFLLLSTLLISILAKKIKKKRIEAPKSKPSSPIKRTR